MRKTFLNKVFSGLIAIAIALIFALQLSQTIPARGQTANNFPTIENQFRDLIASDTAAEQKRENQTFPTEQSYSGELIEQPGETINTNPNQQPGEAKAHKRQNLNLRL